jgi:tetratricopeptide (TPR) repeat protein
MTAPPWLDLVAKLSEIVGALVGVLALVLDVLDKGRRESASEPGLESSVSIPRRWLRVSLGLFCVPLLALVLQVGSFTPAALRTGVDVAAATAGLAALLAFGLHVLQIRRQRLPLPDGLLALLDRQCEDARNHQYGYSVGSAPPLDVIYVDQWTEWRARVPTTDGSGASIPLTIAQMLEKSRNAIVLAEPGVGKSTAINQVLRQQSAWWRDATRSMRPRDAPYGPFMPIALPPDLHGCHRLPDAMARQWEQLTGIKGNPRVFGGRPPYAKSWLVLIDGIDQILSTPTRTDVLARVGGWAADASAPYRFMITSRPLLSGELGPLKAEHVGRFILRKFDAEGIERFARCWADFRKSQHFDDMDMEPITVDRFMGAIKAASLWPLVRVPLIATITALILEASKETALPASRAGLYERFVQHLFSSRHLERLASSAPVQFMLHGRKGERAWAWLLDNLRDILEGVADLHLSAGPPGISECAVRWIQGGAPGGMFEAVPGWEDAISGLLTATSLIVPSPQGLLFAHPNFAEYLAAGPRSKAFDLETWLADARSPDSRSLALFTLARQMRETPGQHEVQLADRLTELLLDRGGAEACLAGDIVADGIEVTPALRTRVVETLFELLERDDEATEALSVLINLVGDAQVLDRLIRFAADPAQHDWSRADAAEELCAVARETGIQLLREVLQRTADSLLQYRILLRLGAMDAVTEDERARAGRFESELAVHGAASSGARAGHWYRQIAEDEANDPGRRLHAVLAMAERRDDGWGELFHAIVIDSRLPEGARLDAGRRAMRLTGEVGRSALRRVTDQAGLPLEVRVPLLAVMAEAQDMQARRALNQLSAEGGAAFQRRFPFVAAWREEIGTRSSEQPDRLLEGARGGSSSVPAIWGNVPPRNKNFTGRADILERLRRGTSSGVLGVVPEQDPGDQAIRGLGGVGKTAIAIEYAWRHRSDYDVVWWIPADQVPAIRASLAQLARRLGLDIGEAAGIDETVRDVLDALRRGDPFSRWLLVFDNADQPEDISAFIPRGPGDVLITSRNARWEAVINTVQLNVWTRTESKEFLTRRVGKGLSASDAERLADKLGDLPLALVQAGAMLGETGMPADEYLRLIDEHVAVILADGKSDSYPMSMTAAWNLSVARLTEQLPQAREFLRVCAFFGPEPIPRDVFRGGRTDNPALSGVLADPILLARVIRELGRFALITVNEGSISVHRLIQALLREEVPAVDQAAYRHDVHLILGTADPGNPDDASSWPRYRDLLPHVASDSVALPEATEPEVRELGLNAMRYLYQSGDYSSCVNLAERFIKQWITNSAPDNPDVLHAQRHLGNALRLLGRYRESFILTQSTLTKSHAARGEADELTLLLRLSFGADLRAHGDFRKAREFDRESRTLLERSYGREDLLTLRLLSSLALDHGLNSDYLGASNLYREIFPLLSKPSAKTPAADILSAWNGMAWSLHLLGEQVAALDLIQDALDYARESLGPEHIATLRTINAYTVICRRFPGRHAEAEEMTRNCLDLSRRLFTDNHPETLAVATSLSNLLRTTSPETQAEGLGLADFVASLSPVVYGEDHPYSYGCRGNLALLQRATGRADEALRLNTQALAGLDGRVGRDHHYSLAVATNLASDLADLGKDEEAKDLGTDTLARLQRVLGPDHVVTLGCAANLALDLGTTGERAAAEALRVDTMNHYRELLGEQHPDTQTALHGLRMEADFDPPTI